MKLLCEGIYTSMNQLATSTDIFYCVQMFSFTLPTFQEINKSTLYCYIKTDEHNRGRKLSVRFLLAFWGVNNALLYPSKGKRAHHSNLMHLAGPWQYKNCAHFL